MKCSLGISNFLEELSSLSHSIVFLYFFALITEEGFLISPCCCLELCIQMGISFLFSFVFCFSSLPSSWSVLLRQPICLFVFLFLGGGFDHCLITLYRSTCHILTNVQSSRTLNSKFRAHRDLLIEETVREAAALVSLS